MYINKLMFVVSTSRWIQFVTAEYVNERSKAALMAWIKEIINLYYTLKFKIATLLMDPEFYPMRDDIYELEGTTLNTTSTKEHVTEIERTIRVLKERMGDLMISLPYKQLLIRMVIDMGKFIAL